MPSKRYPSRGKAGSQSNLHRSVRRFCAGEPGVREEEDVDEDEDVEEEEHEDGKERRGEVGRRGGAGDAARGGPESAARSRRDATRSVRRSESHRRRTTDSCTLAPSEWGPVRAPMREKDAVGDTLRSLGHAGGSSGRERVSTPSRGSHALPGSRGSAYVWESQTMRYVPRSASREATARRGWDKRVSLACVRARRFHGTTYHDFLRTKSEG